MARYKEFLIQAASYAMPAGPLHFIGRILFGRMPGRFEEATGSDRPPPMYSIPESKRKSGLHEEAMAGYAKIAEQYPGEVRPYLAMMEIAIVNLKDPERGSAIYEKGMSVITTPEGQETLSCFYVAHCSRFAGAPEWKKQHQAKVIAPRKRAGNP